MYNSLKYQLLHVLGRMKKGADDIRQMAAFLCYLKRM
jgi:hypothetical protein